MRTKLGICAVAAMAGMYAYASPAMADTASQLRGAINEGQLVTLTHNTRPEAIPANDRGAVASGMEMSYLELVLRRSNAKEKAFEAAIADIHNPKSPSFHHWMTNAEIGEKYGPSNQDIATVSNWLDSHGLRVLSVMPDRTSIAFSGTAEQVGATFHTEFHNLNVNGAAHFANMRDPQIPATLTQAVQGVAGLSNFFPHPMLTKRFTPTKGKKPNYSLNSGCFPADPATGETTSFTNECEFVTPADLATIYDMKPAFNNGITGAGQTIVVVEDTDVYKRADWNIFRAVMGLTGYTQGSFSQIHPQPQVGTANCTDPGHNGDDGEAILDAKYASASAPNAAIELASCRAGGTATIFGGLLAIQNLLTETGHPNIISMSYGECETATGASNNALFNASAQSAAAEGVSLYVSSGDESATSCDSNRANATHGIGVSGWMSSPYDISVGGTDYTDNSNSGNANQWKTYWNASNGTGFGSAKSYIPEQPWNDSCASEVTSTFYTGSNLTYGTSGFCNSAFGEADFLDTGSGSGGPSGCATGTFATGTSNRDVVSGTCAGWPKPAYQGGSTTGVGLGSVITPFKGEVADGVRDTPDVSLFAANGDWGHYYPFCDSDPADAPGAPFTLDGCQTADPANWAGAGGTSFSSPIFAGIQALINQKTGTSWGNTNTVYYALAAAEYGASGNANCSSSTSPSAASSSCVFHDVTAGDFNTNCKALSGVLHNCYLPSGVNGVSTTAAGNASYAPMYKSTSGWDFTTGNGTPDVTNLINAFSGGTAIPSSAKKKS